MNMVVQVSVLEEINFFRCSLKSDMVGSRDNSTFLFSEKLQTDFHSVCTNSHMNSIL